MTIALLLQGIVWADEVAVCDPTHPLVPNAVTRFETSVDGTPLRGRAGFLVWQAPTNLSSPADVLTFTQLRSQFDALAGVPTRYWLCTDTNPVDGTLDSVREMTQTEKDALDAPDVSEAQRQAAFSTEITSNTFCIGELSELDTRIDAAVDSAANNIAGIKTLLKSSLKKLARCVRARAR